jgi:sialic acid synthase SpsE
MTPAEIEKSRKLIIRQKNKSGQVAFLIKRCLSPSEVCGTPAFTSENFDVKRPGNGLPPMRYWNSIGTAAQCDFAKDELIEV